MNAPLLAFHDVVKPYGGPRPLRITGLRLMRGDHVILSGLDAMAAEMFMHVLTGAALPESGRVEVFGQSTDQIRTDAEWLTSLDRFGLVSNRAVLLDQSTIAQNLALPLTLSIDPMADDVRGAVEALARDVGLDHTRLDAAASSLTPPERARVHLARALASAPDVLLLEHPTATLAAEGAAFGEVVRTVVRGRRLTWLAISDDRAFQRATGGTVFQVEASTGALRSADGFWRKWFQ